MRQIRSYHLFLLNLVLFGGSIYLFWIAGDHASQAHKVYDKVIVSSDEIDTGDLAVSTERYIQVAVTLRVDSTSVMTEKDRSREEVKLRFKFPFEYSFIASDGKTIHSENTSISWNNGTKYSIKDHVTTAGGWIQFETSFDKIRVADGHMRVKARVLGDSEFGAKASDLRLIVYDNVFKDTIAVTAGGVLLALSGMAFVGGFVIFILRRSNMSNPVGQKSYMVAVLLSLFVGCFGIDRFYLGYKGLGVLKLITLGGCGVWALLDLILIIIGNLQDANGHDLAR